MGITRGPQKDQLRSLHPEQKVERSTSTAALTSQNGYHPVLPGSTRYAESRSYRLIVSFSPVGALHGDPWHAQNLAVDSPIAATRNPASPRADASGRGIAMYPRIVPATHHPARPRPGRESTTWSRTRNGPSTTWS